MEIMVMTSPPLYVVRGEIMNHEAGRNPQKGADHVTAQPTTSHTIIHRKIDP